MLVLQGRGIGGLRRLFGRGAEHIDLAPFDAQIPGVDVVEHLRQRVLRPGGAVGALVVGEDYELDGRVDGTVGHRIRFFSGVDVAEVGLLGVGDLGDDDLRFRTGTTVRGRRLFLAAAVDDEDHEHECRGDDDHGGGDPPAVLRARCRMFGHALTPGLLRCLVNYSPSVSGVESCESTSAGIDGPSSLRRSVHGRDEQGASGIADEAGAGVGDVVRCAEVPGLGCLLGGIEELPVIG